MGQDHPKMNPTILKSALRQAKARIGIRRGQKLNAIAKKKKDIKGHLESCNEAMALIHVEPLINDERMVPCYDIIAMLCDAILERVPLLERMGKEVPPDMFMTIHTLMYAAPRAGIDELLTISRQLSYLCGPEFTKQSETDERCINETIRENINLIMPEEGWKVDRLIKIAKDEGIQYCPTERCQTAHAKYINRKPGMTNLGGFPPGGPGAPFPQVGQMGMPPSMPQPMLPSGPYSQPPNPPQFPVPPHNPSINPIPPIGPNPGPASNPPAEPNYPSVNQMQPPGPPYPGFPPAGPGFNGPSPYPGIDFPSVPTDNNPPMYPPAAGPGAPGSNLDDIEARLANLKKM